MLRNRILESFVILRGEKVFGVNHLISFAHSIKILLILIHCKLRILQLIYRRGLLLCGNDTFKFVFLVSLLKRRGQAETEFFSLLVEKLNEIKRK